ncbi:MAG: 1,4-alpha-glucan branching protein GlgB [Betaproteobacteria bacterium]|nr:1,4-alpha-glucan branching protein GlgB [Betaproteobacteria bacterium]
MNDRSIQLLREGRLHDPHDVLGVHADAGVWHVRHLAPAASSVSVVCADAKIPMNRLDDRLFAVDLDREPPGPLRLEVTLPDGAAHEIASPWSFPPEIADEDLYLFNEGRLLRAWQVLGAQPRTREGVAGVRFACWAPNAERVSVIGDFNEWDGRAHPMTSRGASGVWELFVPGVGAGALYKFEIRNRASGAVFAKSDPYARRFERRPGTAAQVEGPGQFGWGDDAWLAARATRDWLHAPLNAYEVHAGSWKRHPDGRFYSYRELADHLVPYVLHMGYTHVELLPISEHPLDESWGYQTTGYFAATSRFGTPDDLRHFVDTCHRAGLGVILDWVPGHFPRDAWALSAFDGTSLYEHADPRLGLHHEWGTHVFNYGRPEVRSFLLSSACYWLDEFHFDGLRVDAVASMLYLDYSRKAGEWVPNRFGGRENLEAVDFLRELNLVVHRDFAGALTFAEESTAWPMVSRPTYVGGLGFSMKWNMGWMHDTLAYLAQDPVHRRYHHDRLTFGQVYAYSENFLLPLSHDEVVHGKHSLLDKMPGDTWQKFANLRLLLAVQATTPGKKLLFMGGEFGQGREWRDGAGLDWDLLDVAWHRGTQACARDLNRLYRDTPALHELDFESEGFRWIDCHDAEQSVISFVRRDRAGGFVVVAANFTPVPRHAYRLGVPAAGHYREILNTDSAYYGGSNVGNGAGVESRPMDWMGFADAIELVLPPLSLVMLAPTASSR